MVHAKALANTETWKSFRDASFNIFSDQLYDLDDSGEAFNFNIDELDAPHNPWVVLDDKNYSQFNPLNDSAQLAPSLYDATFGQLMRGLRDRLGFNKASDD